LQKISLRLPMIMVESLNDKNNSNKHSRKFYTFDMLFCYLFTNSCHYKKVCTKMQINIRFNKKTNE